MGTRLRHLEFKDVVEMERALEALPERVNVSTVTFQQGKWYVFFTLLDSQMRDPITREDTFKSGKRRKKNGS